MIWVKILPGKIMCQKQFNYIFKHQLFFLLFSLNKQLQWTFYEKTAIALYDYTPIEPNQLLLKKGCQIHIIGKEGDSKGWWRGKTMERV